MDTFDYLWESGPVMAQSDYFKLGTDSVLLGNFASVQGIKKCVDLGCSSGALSILLLARSDKINMEGLEIDEKACEVFNENMKINNFDQRAKVINGDIKNYREYFISGAYDAVITNPPYFTTDSGDTSPNTRKAAARGETMCTIEDIIKASKYLLRWDGKLFIVFRPERLVELFALMRENTIEPKRMRLVAHKAGAKPSLVLVEGRRGGKSGLSIEDTLYIVDENGLDTDEIKKIYHR